MREAVEEIGKGMKRLGFIQRNLLKTGLKRASLVNTGPGTSTPWAALSEIENKIFLSEVSETLATRWVMFC